MYVRGPTLTVKVKPKDRLITPGENRKRAPITTALLSDGFGLFVRLYALGEHT